MGGHQDLLSGVTQWTQGCFSPRLLLGMWSIMSQETPPPRGIRWMDTGNRSCTVFGDQCELGTKWDGSPLPGCQEARSEVKVDAGVRAAVVGDFHLHPRSHFVPPCPSSLGWRSWDTPTLPFLLFSRLCLRISRSFSVQDVLSHQSKVPWVFLHFGTLG